MFTIIVELDQNVNKLLLKNIETIKPYESRKNMSSPIIIEEDSDKGKEVDRNYDVKVESATSLFFSTGNPSVEIHTGYVHLYKNSMDKIHKDSMGLPLERSTLICVLAIPSFLSITSFVEFISCFKNKITTIRILRDQSPNKYMALLQFTDQKSADSFYRQYNGKPFNSFDPEDCKLVFVSGVEMTSKEDIEENILTPPVVNGLTALHDALHETPHPSEGSSYISPLTKTSVGKFEVPTCPVCLERLDSDSSGIITTLCNHSFHSDCLTKWGDGTCPVCRYAIFDSHVTCGVCQTEENLWICLTCGNIGCGRYVNAHARAHFEETNHTYAMEIETQRVWDYPGDGYVHRLVSNKADGKMVEIPHPDEKKMHEMIEAQFNSKLDMILMEYNELLTQQLSSQRLYFEGKLKELEKEKEMQIENLLGELMTFRQERQKMNTKIEKSQNQMKKQSEESLFLKQLNSTLIENQKQFKIKLDNLEKQYQAKLAMKDQRIHELQEEIKDLYTHLETQSKIEKNPDLEGGSVVIVPPSNPSPSPIRSKKKTGKKMR
jgi:BRCA1-associated protein